MAIEKQKYISKFDPNRIGRAKAHLYYITHRVNREKEKMYRQIFNNTGNVDEAYVHHLIESTRGMNIFKIILNFDPQLEDTFKDLDLRSITHHVMLKVKEIVGKDFDWVAVMHNDHGRPRPDGTPKRHIHSMVFVNGRLEKEHLAMLREVACEQAMKQRLQLDQAREQQQERSIDSLSTSYRPIGTAGGKARRVRGARPLNLKPTMPCPECGYKNQMVKLKSGKYWCRTCEKVQEQSQELEIEQEREQSE